MTGRGFTLLETLLATALAAALMVMILTLGTGFRRTAAQVGRTRIWPSDRLVTLLERDLAMARRVDICDGGIVLDGYGRLEGDLATVRHGPTRTWYRLVTQAGHGYVVRRQSELDSLSNQEVRSDVILAGVAQFRVRQPTRREYSESRTPGDGHHPAGWQLDVKWERGDRPAVSTMLWTR